MEKQLRPWLKHIIQDCFSQFCEHDLTPIFALFYTKLEKNSNCIFINQGSKIALVRSYLRVPQAAGQVKILRFLVNIEFSPYMPIVFCDAGQVPIFRYFETC